MSMPAATEIIPQSAPDIIQKVKILTISPAIPNDTLSFAPDFPEEMRAEIADALAAFAETESWWKANHMVAPSEMALKLLLARKERWEELLQLHEAELQRDPPTERRVQNLLGVRCNPHVPYDPDWKPDFDGGRMVKKKKKGKGKKARKKK